MTHQWLRRCLAGTLLLVCIVGPLLAHAQTCTGNPVVCENQLPGTPQSTWDIPGSWPYLGDTSIQGFATDISVNKGNTVFFKINTNAATYTMDIYRMGYYQGNGARYITSITPSAPLPQTQPACLTDSTTHLVDCGNWNLSASWNIPSTAVSGIYFVRLQRSDTGGVNHILFIVRDDSSGSDIVFQTSDLTWQAYNRYGGYGLYFPTTGRAYKVSYNRPFITRGCCDESFVFSTEYPMVRWLEANGYNVSYISGIDTDRYGSLLLSHKAFLSVGHDEYWSGGQRTNVETARGASVNIGFFSGNEIFWKTRWEPSIDGTNMPYRTLVCYKETMANKKIDPSSTWTGTWRDARFSPPSDGGRPENALSGDFYMVDCCTQSYQLTYSITVPQEDGQMRIWRNTGVDTLLPGSVATFPPGTLGYEWGEDVDNGSRPPGLFHVSTTQLNVDLLSLDKWGNSYGAGVATHHLEMYRASSGALVFGAGSERWSWGLDATHDSGTSPTDPRMQQATVNLLADMGVQPGSLQPGLVPASPSTDTQPPISSISAPPPGATFSQEQPLTITGSAFDNGGGQVAGVEVSVDAGNTWHPASGRTSWSYAWVPELDTPATIMSRAVDDSGNLETPSSSVTVNISQRPCPCSVWDPTAVPGLISNPDTSANELGVKFQVDTSGYITGIRFYKGSTNTGTHVAHLWTTSGVLLASATFTNETASGWQQVSFPPVAVKAGSTYVASYYAPNGGYSSDTAFFTSGVDRPPLHILANGVVGPNGVYKYNASGYPNLTYRSTNYWVDLVFVNTLQ